MTKYLVVKIWRGIFEGVEEFDAAEDAERAAARWREDDADDAAVIRVDTDGTTLTVGRGR